MCSPAEAINCKDGGLDPILELFADRGKIRDVYDAVARIGFDPAQTLLWANLGIEAMLDKTKLLSDIEWIDAVQLVGVVLP